MQKNKSTNEIYSNDMKSVDKRSQLNKNPDIFNEMNPDENKN